MTCECNKEEVDVNDGWGRGVTQVGWSAPTCTTRAMTRTPVLTRVIYSARCVGTTTKGYLSPILGAVAPFCETLQPKLLEIDF